MKLLTAIVGVVSIGTLLTVAPVLAHHSFSAEFDSTRPVTLNGTITEMKWTNPHCWLHIDVKGPDGTVVNWAIEFALPQSLYRRGWRKSDLPFGAEVIVDGYLAKDNTPTANASNVILPDGRRLFAGTSGSSAP